jgi:hypothetical protein
MFNQELEKSGSLEKQISERARHFSKELLKFILKEIRLSILLLIFA